MNISPQLRLQFDEPARTHGRIPEGMYTIVRTDGHYTYRVTDITEGTFKGKTIVSLLVGPDNTRNYQGCGFLDRHLGIVRLWSRWFNTKLAEHFNSDMRILMSDADNARQEYALNSGRCARCHRVLTVPASLHRGVGPECAKYL